jgi:hypothetical protein
MHDNPSKYWTPQTRLDSLGLPYLDVVLTERFLLPPDLLKRAGEEVPETIGDLERLTGMLWIDVCQVLNECLEVGENIWLEVEELNLIASETGTMILDMRPDVSYETEPLHPSAKVFHMHNPSALIPLLRTLSRVLVISDSESHAWSAAMSLRKMNIPAYLPRKTSQS